MAVQVVRQVPEGDGIMATEQRAATKKEIATEMTIWQAANPTLNAEKKHQEALAEGYKDEVCPRCGVVFLAFYHFVKCSEDICPMKDGKPSLLEQIFG
jgi:hypothetical protein